MRVPWPFAAGALLVVCLLLLLFRARGLTAHVINRVSRPDRLERFWRAGHVGLHVRVMPAVEVPQGMGRLTRGEVGCFFSHATAWARVVEAGDAAAVVLEDDANLQGLNVPALITCDLPADWDVVFLGANWSDGPSAAASCVVRPSAGMHGAHCYVVSQKGAALLLRLAPAALAAGMAVDIFLSSPPVEYYQLVGSPVRPFDLADSDTQGLV